MIFDQFQRYKTIEIIVNILREELQKKSLTVLEIGTNEECNLEKVLPNDEIQYSDIVLSEEMEGDSRFIQVDGCNMPEILDGQFDVAIALDVFEHVSNEKREQFMSEINRVAKHMAIVCFPYSTFYNESAEKRVNAYYKMIFGSDHKWLIEHIQNGLPQVDHVRELLAKKGVCYREFYHGDVFLWEEMMKALFTVYGLQNGGYYFEEIDRLYEELMYFNDSSETSYRVFMLLSKSDRNLQYLSMRLQEKYNGQQSEKIQKLVLRCTDDFKYRLVSEQGRKIRVQQQMYFSFDGSFCEAQKWVHSSESLDANIVRVYWRIELDKQYKALRFDPIEDENCIVKNLLIESNIGELNFEVLNGIYDKGRIIFCDEDPQIYIDLQNKIEWICIYADIIRTDFPEAVIRFPLGRKIDRLEENLLESTERNSSNFVNVHSLLTEYIQSQNELNSSLIRCNEFLDAKIEQCEELRIQLQASADRELTLQTEKEEWKIRSKKLEDEGKSWEEQYLQQKEKRRYLEEQYDCLEKQCYCLEEQKKQLEEEKKQMEEQSCHWEARCARMEQTISWRITAVLRKFGKLLQRKEG